MKEQQLQDKLDEYYNRGIQHGILRMAIQHINSSWIMYLAQG